MKLKILISSLALLFLFSCKKRISENVHPEFIGEWQYYDDFNIYYLKIDKNGNAIFSSTRSLDSDIKGVVKASESKLKIGAHKFIIIDYPHKIDTATIKQPSSWYHPQGYVVTSYGLQMKKGNWKMELSSDRSITFPLFSSIAGGPFTFYKADY